MLLAQHRKLHRRQSADNEVWIVATDRQLRTNRLNALKSTGPRTVEGKTASSRNALRHGLTAIHVVVQGEDAARFEALRRDLLDEFEPETTMQAILVDQLAAVVWRLRRAAAYEPALLSWIGQQQAKAHDEHGVVLGDVFLPIKTNGLTSQTRTATRTAVSSQDLMRTGRTLEAAMAKSDLLSKLSRYETHLIRQMEKILSQIE